MDRMLFMVSRERDYYIAMPLLMLRATENLQKLGLATGSVLCHVTWALLALRLARSRPGRWPRSLNRMPDNSALHVE